MNASATALGLAARHPGTPWYAKCLALALAAYALSPIDLIPDPIPILGLLDDLILLPIGIWLVLKMIPSHVWEECMARATAGPVDGEKPNWTAAVVIIVLWLVALWLVIFRLWPAVRVRLAG